MVSATELAELAVAFAVPIGAVGSILAAYWARGGRGHAKKASEQSTATNDAVNNTHEDNPTIYDLVIQGHNENTAVHAALIAEVEAVQAALNAHVAWEETVKYSERLPSDETDT